jgi:hypothetical protein
MTLFKLLKMNSLPGLFGLSAGFTGNPIVDMMLMSSSKDSGTGKGKSTGFTSSDLSDNLINLAIVDAISQRPPIMYQSPY